MEISGRLINILPLQSGTGRNGEWKKQEVIIETLEQYPKKICIALWNDKINAVQFSICSDYNFAINVESREYNGKWYTEVRAYRVSQNGSYRQANVTSETSTGHQDDYFVDDGLPF